MKRFIATIVLLAAFALSADAFTLEPMFSDGMVLAKGKPIRVFGEREGRISVSLAGKRAVCQAVDGRWEAVLPAMKAGGPYRMTFSYPGGKAVVEDVYIGTVIIMAGQSNIQFKLKESSSAPESWKSEPLLPYAVSAVVWYQGESNTGSGEAAIYPLLARELVLSWREAFKDPSLPFTIVQIADYVHRPDPSWKAVQEAQLRIPTVVPGVIVVKSADVCETDNIHPKTKDGLSERIAGTLP